MKKRKESGITLIALIVTIVLLLILAGIVINLLLGENGLIQKAIIARERDSVEQERTLIELAADSTQMRMITEENLVEEDVFLEELEKNFGEGGLDLDPLGNSIYDVTVKKSGRIYNVDISTGTIDSKGNSETEKFPKKEDYADVPNTEDDYFVFDPTTGSITSLKDIEGYYNGEITYPTIIKIPDKIDGVTVTSVVLSGGAEISNVTDIVIPDTVTVIGQAAFQNMDGLKNVVMPSMLEKIEKSAFSHCESIEKLEIPNTVKSIGRFAFRNTDSLKELTITSDDIEIAGSCFYRTGTEKINITGNYIQIKYESTEENSGNDCSLIKHCSNLVKMNIGHGEVSVDECVKLKNININVKEGSDIKISGCVIHLKK